MRSVQILAAALSLMIVLLICAGVFTPRPTLVDVPYVKTNR